MFQNLNTNLFEGSLAPIQASTVKPAHQSQPQHPMSKPVPKKEDKVAWFKLFAELDPLGNPDNLPGSNTNQSHAA